MRTVELDLDRNQDMWQELGTKHDSFSKYFSQNVDLSIEEGEEKL
jgi:hypothetical protein